MSFISVACRYCTTLACICALVFAYMLRLTYTLRRPVTCHGRRCVCPTPRPSLTPRSQCPVTLLTPQAFATESVRSSVQELTDPSLNHSEAKDFTREMEDILCQKFPVLIIRAFGALFVCVRRCMLVWLLAFLLGDGCFQFECVCLVCDFSLGYLCSIFVSTSRPYF